MFALRSYLPAVCFLVTKVEREEVLKRTLELTGKTEDLDRKDFGKLFKKASLESIPPEVMDRLFLVLARVPASSVTSAKLSEDQLVIGLSVLLKGTVDERAGCTFDF